VTKSYVAGDTVTRALRGVDLDVAAGELLMLVGPSGCGKTTLISVIAGILNQDAGQCTVFGHDLHHMTDRQRTIYRGRNIGFVFQAYNLIPTLSARENVAVPLLIGGMGRREALKQAGDFLDFVGLTDKVESLPTQLSGGQQQRVAVARSLVHQPRLIVCDEPTSALDQDTGHKIMGLFRSVARANDRALIVVTHDSRIFSFADRIARMNDGVIESVSNGEATSA
jgi:putative ABC transport system ATP-binding protein